jgi:D-aspartate ligase
MTGRGEVKEMSKSGSNSRPKVVIPGFSLTSLGTARCLAGSGHKIISIGSRGVAYKMPMYYSNIPMKKVLIHPEENIVKALLDIKDEFKEPPVLLLTEDKHVVEVSKDRTLIDKFYIFLIPDDYIVDHLMDKKKFAKLAERENLKVPKTIEITELQGIYDFIHEYSFPFLLKPFLRHARKINNEADLESYLTTLSPINWSSVVVQEFIPGDDSSLFFCFVYFNRSSEPLGYLTAQKVRQWPPEYGSTSLCKTVSNEYVLEETLRIFRRLGMAGPGSIEYKRHAETGEYFIMEPTIGRFDQQIALTQAAGINLPLMAASYLEKGEATSYEQKDGVWWIYEPSDYLSQKSTRQQMKGDYWRHLLKADSHVLWSWRDPMPFVSSLVSGIVNLRNELS